MSKKPRGSELARHMEATLRGKVRAARDALHHTGGAAAAATAFDGILNDPVSLRAVELAALRFDLSRTRAKGPRQGDLFEVVEGLQDAVQNVARLSDRLNRLFAHFGAMKGAPAWCEIAAPAAEAFVGLHDLAAVAARLEAAVLAEHGDDGGGPRSLSDALAGDPLDRLADDLAAVWTGAGQGFDRACWRDFEAILRALNEALGGGDDLPERALKRIKRNLKKRTELVKK